MVCSLTPDSHYASSLIHISISHMIEVTNQEAVPAMMMMMMIVMEVDHLLSLLEVIPMILEGKRLLLLRHQLQGHLHLALVLVPTNQIQLVLVQVHQYLVLVQVHEFLLAAFLDFHPLALAEQAEGGLL